MLDVSLGEEIGNGLDEVVYGVFENNLDAVWPKVLPILTKALDRDADYSPQDIYSQVKNYESQLMVCERAGAPEFVLVTSIVHVKNKKACSLFLAAGENARHWISYLGSVENWARQSGCDSIRLSGRPGWQKLLKDYRLKDIVLEKSL